VLISPNATNAEVSISPVGSTINPAISNPTAQQGEEIVELKKDIELIEQTAIATSSELYQYIMENVTKDVPWEYLDIPLSRRSFFYMRRKYFYLLSLKK